MDIKILLNKLLIMKTISLELSKKLAPYLEWVETEYGYRTKNHLDMEWNITWKYRTDIVKNWYQFQALDIKNNMYTKTLTLEEAIEFLPNYIQTKYDWQCWWEINHCNTNFYEIRYTNWGDWYNLTMWNTLLEAIEKILEYLLTEKLLWNICEVKIG